MAGTEPSQYPPPNEPTPGLFFTAFGDCDFGDGSVENLAYHPADNRAARYMLKAWRQANATSE
jgi:hypothetical protein